MQRTKTPNDIHIVVAGGPGPQDVYIAGGLPQTLASQDKRLGKETFSCL